MNRTFKMIWIITLACLAMAPAIQATEPPSTGLVIEDFGPAYMVPGEPFNLLPGKSYRVVMDVGSTDTEKPGPNRSIESMARLLNMSARHGIDPAGLQLAVVLHGNGAMAALNQGAHQRIHGSANESAGLVKALGAAGVKFYLCGQTAGYRGYQADDLLPEITMAVSAMTAHVRLQSEGYQLIPF